MRDIALRLHELIMSSGNEVEARMAHGIPFYYGKKRMFYLNPAEGHLSLGFCYGAMLVQEGLIFDKKGHKQVGTIRISSVRQTEDPRLHELLYQALELDRQH